MSKMNEIEESLQKVLTLSNTFDILKTVKNERTRNGQTLQRNQKHE